MSGPQADPKVIALIRAKFEMCRDVTALAREAGISRTTLYKHASALGLKRIDPPRRGPTNKCISEFVKERLDTSGLVNEAIHARTPLEQAWRPE